MEYAQLSETGTEAIQITTHGNVEWDGNNFCSAEALIKDGKAGQFRVVPLTETPQPTFDSATQKVVRDGCVKVGNDWCYNWRVDDLSTSEKLAIAKQARYALVDALTVITTAGNTFNGDEASQNRMSRAITAMNAEDQTLWVLANNTPILATQAELREALRKSGEAMTAIWVAPYQ